MRNFIVFSSTIILVACLTPDTARGCIATFVSGFIVNGFYELLEEIKKPN